MTLLASYDRILSGIDENLLRRDLEMAINMVIWEDNPFQRMLPVGKTPISRTFEMHVRNLTSPTAVTSAVEGGAPSSYTTNLPKMLSCGLHYALSEGYGVSGTDMALPLTWSGDNSLADQAAIKLREFVMQTDLNYLWSTFQAGTSDGQGTGTSRRCAGLIQWLATTGAHRNAGSTVDITGTTVPSYANSYLHDFGTTPMTVDALNAALVTPRTNGTRPGNWTLVVPPLVKVFLDGLMVTATLDPTTERLLQQYTRPIDSRRVGQNVDFIQTTWGIIPIMEVKHLSGVTQAINLTGSSYDYTVDGNDLILGLDFSAMSQHVLRPFEMQRLGRDSDAVQEYFVHEGAPNPGHPAKHMVFLNPRGTGS